MQYIDLFCGIGGFRLAAEAVLQERTIASTCVFSSDIDSDCQSIYEANFGERPVGDIRTISTLDIPDHEILFAGFPCQPFSIIGTQAGFEDTRGTLFFEIIRILEAKRPCAFVLENVKQLVSHDKGRTLRRIMEALSLLGYTASYKVLNALDFGLPQKRERIFIVGFIEPVPFKFPVGYIAMRSLDDLLEDNTSEFYRASQTIRANRLASHSNIYTHHTIWHENKGGHIGVHPYSCALRAGASYNYLLVDGERRLTEREMLRLQGFPDTYKIACGYAAMRRLTGNSVAISVVKAVLHSVLDALQQNPVVLPVQQTFFDEEILQVMAVQ